MSAQLYFWFAFLILSFLIIFFDKKYLMLRDISTAARKPYSFARVQLAWWSVIVLASLISIVASKGGIPTLDSSTLILLGISSATIATASIIDLSDESNPNIFRTQDENSQNFILDILSDEKGVSIHRFQIVIFNITFGIWFICTVIYNLGHFAGDINMIIPKVEENNLILLGLSSGTYAALKTAENKSNQRQAPANTPQEFVPDEALSNKTKAQG